MIDEFALYARLGVHHILDLAGTDHLLFVVALAIPYARRDWRRLALLVTAFTLGHSITLALATLHVVSVPSALIEALIPATIVVTAVVAWRSVTRSASSAVPQETSTRAHGAHYLLATVFGLVHGLGFSTYLRALLGSEESIVWPLLSFNVGLEMGQLLILLFTLLVNAFVVPRLLSHTRWVQWLALTTGGWAAVMLIERL